MRAWVGSLFMSSNSVSVVNKVPFGWVADLLACWVGARWAGASDWSNDMLAPVSSNAVVLRSGGLLQPGVGRVVLVK